MNIEDKNYDLRQFEAMRLQLSQFEQETIKLSHLISGLDALLCVIRTLDKDWKEAFKSEWWNLEQVYAVALDRQKAAFSAEDGALIKEAVGNLKKLIADATSQLEREA